MGSVGGRDCLFLLCVHVIRPALYLYKNNPLNPKSIPKQAFLLPVLSVEERRLRSLPGARKRQLPAALSGALGGAFAKVCVDHTCRVEREGGCGVIGPVHRPCPGYCLPGYRHSVTITPTFKSTPSSLHPPPHTNTHQQWAYVQRAAQHLQAPMRLVDHFAVIGLDEEGEGGGGVKLLNPEVSNCVWMGGWMGWMRRERENGGEGCGC